MNLNEYSQTVLRDSCIISTHSKNAKGYAIVTHPAIKYKTVLEHRLMFARANGLKLADIKNKLILHMCDNPGCINPAHLFIGTHQDNVNDMYSKKRNVVSHVSRNQGEKCGTSKYTAELVLAIRAETKLNVMEIAAKYNIPRTTASGIYHRRTWKHI